MPRFSLLFGFFGSVAAVLASAPQAQARHGHGHGHHHAAHHAAHAHRGHSGHRGGGHSHTRRSAAQRFGDSAVSAAGASVGRHAVNAVLDSKSAGPRESTPRPTRGSSSGGGGQVGAENGALAHCPDFRKAMQAHAQDAGYAARLKSDAPECFAGDSAAAPR
jgi:hypothetical protein